MSICCPPIKLSCKSAGVTNCNIHIFPLNFFLNFGNLIRAFLPLLYSLCDHHLPRFQPVSRCPPKTLLFSPIVTNANYIEKLKNGTWPWRIFSSFWGKMIKKLRRWSVFERFLLYSDFCSSIRSASKRVEKGKKIISKSFS